MASAKRYHVDYYKDSDADVWIATSKDVPGLVLESESLDLLMQRVPDAIPDLLDSNDTITIQDAHFEQVYM